MENEEVIVERAKTEPEAFGRLYDMYYQPVFGFLFSRTGNVEVAKDLTSETFFQALKNINKYRVKGKPFKSWLFAIAVAQNGNYFRQRNKVFSITLDECPELVAQNDQEPDQLLMEDEVEVEKKEQIFRLRRFMTQLNQKQQNILTLRFFSHLSIPEISQVMSMKEGTIKSHLHRALKKLQVLMTEEEVNINYERVQPDKSRITARAARLS